MQFCSFLRTPLQPLPVHCIEMESLHTGQRLVIGETDLISGTMAGKPIPAHVGDNHLAGGLCRACRPISFDEVDEANLVLVCHFGRRRHTYAITRKSEPLQAVQQPPSCPSQLIGT